jgi:hypothetical protein
VSKFNSSRPVRPQVQHAVKTTEVSTPTFEGGNGFSRDEKSELFLLAITNFVNEDTFYESGDTRDNRFRDLIHKVTASDPEWMQARIPWLRNEAQMRTASLVAAAEYVKAGGENGRQIVSSALLRADEPGELLGYWHQTYGRRMPKAVKRGIADAVQRLYNERNALKYDGIAKSLRFADVIELVHPDPIAPWQSELFKYLLDERHGRKPNVPDTLKMIQMDRYLINLPEDQRREAVSSDAFSTAGWTWERLSGWLPGGMDKQAIERLNIRDLLSSHSYLVKPSASASLGALLHSELVQLATQLVLVQLLRVRIFHSEQQFEVIAS